MSLLPILSLLIVLITFAFGFEDDKQFSFRPAQEDTLSSLAPKNSSWNIPPDPDDTGHLIFDTVAQFLRHWSNSYYRNGHNIVPVTFEPGLLLFHGSRNSTSPPGPEWIAFDEDHAISFSYITTDYGTIFNYISTRELRFLYFDGSSAAKLPSGVMDSQDIVLFGNVTDQWTNELMRIKELCEWGEQYDIDGFLRMEYEFEVMFCNFTNGIQLVSSMEVIPYQWSDMCRPHRSLALLDSAVSFDQPSVSSSISPEGPCLQWPIPPPPPPTWEGSLRPLGSLLFELMRAGNLHDVFALPGFHIDYSRLVTFYNPKYRSLVDWRRTTPSRFVHRLTNISNEDVQLFRGELHEVLTRPSNQRGSGIAWSHLIRHVVERHADRLDLLKYILRDVSLEDAKSLTDGINATEVMLSTRQHILTMLSPYLAADSVPPNKTWTSTEWLAPAVHRCWSSYTSGTQFFSLSPQESLIKNSIDKTTKEICRTLAVIWSTAFSAEKLAFQDDLLLPLLRDWKKEVHRLISWLGWAILEKCVPACAEEEFCAVPEWPFDGVDDGTEETTPHCLPRLYWTHDWKVFLERNMEEDITVSSNS